MVMDQVQFSLERTAEETANFITHLAGVILSAAALSVLVTLGAIYGDVWRIVSFSIYGATLVILYLFSTLYHALRSPRVKQVFRILDHVSIYLLIAGSYTPFALVSLRGGWGWSLFWVVWGVAAAGIVFRLCTSERWHFISVITYILMGWIAVIAIKPLIDTIPFYGILWLVAGGLSYTFGVLFYINKRLKYHHAIWHCFVLAGSMCHFFVVLFYVLPMK